MGLGLSGIAEGSPEPNHPDPTAENATDKGEAPEAQPDSPMGNSNDSHQRQQ